MSWSHCFSGKPADIAREVKARVDYLFVFDAAASIIAMLEHLEPSRHYSLSTNGHHYNGVMENMKVNLS